MSKEVIEMFGLTQSSDGEYAYLKQQIDKEDYVRLVMEYQILLDKYNDLSKKHNALLINTRNSFAKMKKDIDALKKYNKF